MEGLEKTSSAFTSLLQEKENKCFLKVLHSEEASPGVRTLLSPKPEKLGSFFTSCSLEDSSGLEEVDDDLERKRYELHGELSDSRSVSPAPVANKKTVNHP